MTVLHDFKATAIDGAEVSLGECAGDVVLVVNTASECGYTPQLGGLEQLYETYRVQGLTVLGFPCNQFGGQDPASDEEIGAFCQKNYGVTFPMFAKVEVNGSGEHPLFTWLKSEAGGLLGKKIKWNFTKFLVARDGTVIARYSPTTEPADLAADIEKALAS
ncbi:glutathione peroxidase [Terrabacter sp. MAHUQ-38]|uniref:glutathione peroxidase n=1 Tax=unclassified Terrabacter TaxID=2630222 RepID=UPI00165E10E3|nr:glutathione peroxidase [Terrabacter sp. MAHUQ-38]